MKIPIYLDSVGKKTFRAYTLHDGRGEWHLFNGVKGPARLFETDEYTLLYCGQDDGELEVGSPEGRSKTAEECWVGATEVSNSHQSQEMRKMSAASELTGSEFAQLLLEGKGLSRYQAFYLDNALMECVVEGLKVIRAHDCVPKLEKMITIKAQNNAHDQNPVPVLNALRTLVFSCTWRVPDDEPVYRLVSEDLQ